LREYAVNLTWKSCLSAPTRLCLCVFLVVLLIPYCKRHGRERDDPLPAWRAYVERKQRPYLPNGRDRTSLSPPTQTTPLAHQAHSRRSYILPHRLLPQSSYDPTSPLAFVEALYKIPKSLHQQILKQHFKPCLNSPDKLQWSPSFLWHDAFFPVGCGSYIPQNHFTRSTAASILTSNCAFSSEDCLHLSSQSLLP
jgi:hypothetical protein